MHLEENTVSWIDRNVNESAVNSIDVENASCICFLTISTKIDYFARNYRLFRRTILSRFRLNERSRHNLEIRILDKYLRVLNDLPLTNNNMEGWLRAFNSSASAHSPHI
ncbi:hypothetical protein RF11_01669 [Thelohanellus kitauei]|uniref:Uncharacterized protein n=1 Tax=Thelohanellus kitauei TaxID=669202 RepID=A0A0C2JE39_THEKT|nr:hypothetical protein RF11_01669 [Thelohanellus kitauei]